MTNELSVYYDEEGDFLELQVGDYTEGYFKNIGDGIFERVDKMHRIFHQSLIGGIKWMENPGTQESEAF